MVEDEVWAWLSDHVISVCGSFIELAKSRGDASLQGTTESLCANLTRDVDRLLRELEEMGAESPAVLLNMLVRAVGELMALYFMFKQDIIWTDMRLKEKVRSIADKLITMVVEELDKKYIWYCGCGAEEQEESSEPKVEENV